MYQKRQGQVRIKLIIALAKKFIIYFLAPGDVMSLSKEEIIALSDKYPIILDAYDVVLKKIETVISAVVDQQKYIGELDNHLDHDFMKSLENGDYLDTDSLPISA